MWCLSWVLGTFTSGHLGCVWGQVCGKRTHHNRPLALPIWFCAVLQFGFYKGWKWKQGPQISLARPSPESFFATSLRLDCQGKVSGIMAPNTTSIGVSCFCVLTLTVCVCFLKSCLRKRMTASHTATTSDVCCVHRLIISASVSLNRLCPIWNVI